MVSPIVYELYQPAYDSHHLHDQTMEQVEVCDMRFGISVIMDVAESKQHGQLNQYTKVVLLLSFQVSPHL